MKPTIEDADDEIETPPPAPSLLLAWLRLMRLPNVFTALADVTMGFVVVRQSLEPVGAFALLAAASAMLYTAGMVLNDVFDIEIDRLERPGRPLPSGQIPLGLARGVGFGLLGLGVLSAVLAGLLFPLEQNWPLRSGVVAAILATAILLYNIWLKHTPLGPLGMGSCRFLNVLLGMSLLDSPQIQWTLGYEPLHLLIAGGIGVYIVGVTWFARHEAGLSSRFSLIGAMVVMAGGVGLLAAASNWIVAMEIEQHLYFILLALLMLTVLRRTATAAANPHPELVQLAVKHSILSLIWLDAAVCATVAPVNYAVAIAALLIPAFLLGRWVYST